MLSGWFLHFRTLLSCPVSIFDSYIAKITEYVNKMKADGQLVREYRCKPEIRELLEGVPVRTGPAANQGIILRGDTFMELGNPEAGACAFLVWTDNPSLVSDGRITLIGPDIPESPGASLPFGQVLIVAGPSLTSQDHRSLENAQYIGGHIEGYMIRSVPQQMWSRVSKEAAAKGFRFESLGRALMSIYKTQIPSVSTMETLFITSSKGHLEPLEDMAIQVRQVFMKTLTEEWKAKGFDVYECSLGWDCQSCPDQVVCDDIKEIIDIKKVAFQENRDENEISHKDS